MPYTVPTNEFCYMTVIKSTLVVWNILDEKKMRLLFTLLDGLNGVGSIVDWCTGMMERLTRVLLSTPVLVSGYRVVQVIDYKSSGLSKKSQYFRSLFFHALKILIPLLEKHYPQLLEKLFIIGVSEKLLMRAEIPNHTLSKTIILRSREALATYLGDDVPEVYGGNGKQLQEIDCQWRGRPDIEKAIELHRLKSTSSRNRGVTDNVILDKPNRSSSKDRESDIPTPCTSSSTHPKDDTLEQPQPQKQLMYSARIGFPTYVLDPEELAAGADLFNGRLGARLVRPDDRTLVKFGKGLSMAEAEAMHLVQERTTIPAPRLENAYSIDGICYIIMTYEEGEPFVSYWEKASTENHDKAIQQLKGYVEQLRSIKSHFIGGVDGSPCRDGMFATAWGSEQPSYGPFDSEASFNEGIVQALENRLPPDLRGNKDVESKLYNMEYINRQRVRALKGHEIVFTHGDLHPSNMLVRKDGTVVLLDWGSAGFWPEYWEYYRCMSAIPWKHSWDREVEKFVPLYYIEHMVMTRVFNLLIN